MASSCTDPRGVSRGKCSLCRCLSYTRSMPDGIKCVECGHPPAKHVNVSAPAGAAPPQAAASFAGVAPPQAAASFAGAAHDTTTRYEYHHHSPAYSGGYVGSTASGYTPPNQVPPSVNLPRCPAVACHNKVHYDNVLGPFDYCSPECRDSHLLPIEQQKLKGDIASFSKNIATLPVLVSMQPSQISSQNMVEDVRIELIKQPKEPLGIITTKIRGSKRLLITGVEVKSAAYKYFRTDSVKFLDEIEELNGTSIDWLKESFEESARNKSRPNLKLKRNSSIPSLKRFLTEVGDRCPSATHVLALNSKNFSSEQKFEMMAYFKNEKGMMISIPPPLIPTSCAHHSGVKEEDGVRMYAVADRASVGVSKVVYKHGSIATGDKYVREFSEETDKAAKEQKTLLLAIERKY